MFCQGVFRGCLTIAGEDVDAHTVNIFGYGAKIIGFM